MLRPSKMGNGCKMNIGVREGVNRHEKNLVVSAT